MGVAIVGSVFAFLSVCAIVAQLVVHKNDAPAVFWSGAVAAAWCIWPAIKGHQVERYNVLRPVPRRYKIVWKNAYAKVREILDRAHYKMGSRWNVTSDPQSRHIRALLTFTDEEGHFDAPGGRVENIQYRTERVKRLVELDVQFKEEDEYTVVQLDFQTQAEGRNPIYACDFVVEDIKSAVERELGPGTDAGSPAQFTLEAPPWWLLAFTGFGLLSLWQEVMATVFGK